MKVNMVFIKQEYFKDHKDFVEMLDPNDQEKQSRRRYIFFEMQYKGNTILAPLRTNIPKIDQLGNVAFKVPGENRPNAGIDYRKLLIINNNKYIERPEYNNISRKQMSTISTNYEKIQSNINKYIDGYIKSAKKGRNLIDKKFRFSTLHNYHNELGINIKIEDKLEDKIEAKSIDGKENEYYEPNELTKIDKVNGNIHIYKNENIKDDKNCFIGINNTNKIERVSELDCLRVIKNDFKELKKQESKSSLEIKESHSFKLK